jgi:putative drug exporter of the RND superfamily
MPAARRWRPGPQYARFAAGDAAYLSVVPRSDDSDRLDDLVVDLRAAPAPFDVLVGGSAAVGHDSTAALSERLPMALLAVGVLMFGLLFLLTESVVLPLVSIVLSALSLTATFGALVWIFQDGHLSDLLGFTATGSLAATIPVMLFALAFGLAMDYQVFLLARIREEYDRTGATRAAVALGLERVGRIVTAAAVLISIVFCGFLVSGVSFVKAFGIGLPLAVLVDATLIRGAMLPATIRLLGDRAWWSPRWLRRVHGRLGLREDVSEPERVSVGSS